MSSKPLDASQLHHRLDPASLGFQTTRELEPLEEPLGQERALQAVQFGTAIERDGYNLFAFGPAGTGKHTFIRRFLDRKAAAERIPSDCCYVNNFHGVHKPRAVHVPPGWGVKLRRDMQRLLEELQVAIPTALESDEHRARVQELQEEFKEKQENALEEFSEEAEKRNVRLLRSPAGFMLAPIRDDQVLRPEAFHALPTGERTEIESVVTDLQKQLSKVLHQIGQWKREALQKERELHRQTTAGAASRHIDGLRKEYGEFPAILAYLDEVEQDVVENGEDFQRQGDEDNVPTFFGMPVQEERSFRRYRVNVLVDHSPSHGAPVVYEDNPTYHNLMGRVEHISQLGALVTDFNLIKAGALHLANGGYLILDAHKLLTQPFAWDGLKRALNSGELRMDSPAQMFSIVSTVSLEPQPVPLSVKVVLLGERLLYYLLRSLDPEFGELFKVPADFEDHVPRDPSNGNEFARLIAAITREEVMKPLDRTAVARVIEESSRMLGDAERLSIHMRSLTDLLRETDYWSEVAGRKVATAADVDQAIQAKIHRSDRLRSRLQEEIERGTVLIETTGTKTGQVNALSVIDLGDFAFGRPSRVTATARVGQGELIDIEREVKLGGAVHSKGVLILSGFIASRYAKDRPLSVSASLVFEQSYGEVEGDSASLAELCALLSALSDIPIRQSLAVTGSVNQHGQVQPVGGVNEKIEGFFEACKIKGLTGDQGVLVPFANTSHLMLRQEVVDAAGSGQFHVYPVSTVDDALELMTGMSPGERSPDGTFPAGTVNGRVEAQLLRLAYLRQSFIESGKERTSSLDLEE